MVDLQFAQVGMKAVADLDFAQTPEALDRIAFRTAGRERQAPHVGEKLGISHGQMAVDLSLDHALRNKQSGIYDLLEEEYGGLEKSTPDIRGLFKKGDGIFRAEDFKNRNTT